MKIFRKLKTRIFRIVEERSGNGSSSWRVEEKDALLPFWPFTKLGPWEIVQVAFHRHRYGKVYGHMLTSLQDAEALYEQAIKEYKERLARTTKKSIVLNTTKVR